MKIYIFPIAAIPGHEDDNVSLSGDILTHNGRAFDLSAVPEGGSADPDGDHPFVGPITRTDGVLHLGLRMTYDTATAEPIQPVDPAHWLVDVADGPVPDRVVRKATEGVE